MGRDDDACRSGAFGAAADGAEVARVGHAIEANEKRALPARARPRVGIAVGLRPRNYALVVARATGVRRSRSSLS
jgi:hypothetical protein